jgi:hypothetical protein
MISKHNQADYSAELRKRADEILREDETQLSINIDAFTHEEIREKLHALQAHQIELDMQSEELRQAQLELDAARERYFNFWAMHLTPPYTKCSRLEKPYLAVI